jgi:hypothetical protein
VGSRPKGLRLSGEGGRPSPSPDNRGGWRAERVGSRRPALLLLTRRRAGSALRAPACPKQHPHEAAHAEKIRTRGTVHLDAADAAAAHGEAARCAIRCAPRACLGRQPWSILSLSARVSGSGRARRFRRGTWHSLRDVGGSRSGLPGSPAPRAHRGPRGQGSGAARPRSGLALRVGGCARTRRGCPWQ